MRQLLWIPMVLVALAGCGGDAVAPVPVSGNVIAGTKPVEGALVTFHNSGGGRTASGLTDSDGTFTLTTNRTGDGAQPGEYVVTIAKQESKIAGADDIDVASGEYGEAYGAMMDAAATGDMSKVLKDTLPGKYSSAETSGLTRTVVAGEENVFEFTL